MTRIHETALVDCRAEIDSDVEVGPYSIVSGCVKIGKGSRVKSHVVIEGRTTIGEGNVIFQFATVGSVPQDLKYKGSPASSSSAITIPFVSSSPSIPGRAAVEW